MATHNVDIVRTLPHRTITIEDGRLVSDQPAKKGKGK